MRHLVRTLAAPALAVLVAAPAGADTPAADAENSPQRAWPQAAWLKDSVVSVKHDPVPPASQIFGSDPMRMIKGWLDPHPSQQGRFGRNYNTSAAFLGELGRPAMTFSNSIMLESDWVVKKTPFYSQEDGKGGALWAQMLPAFPAQSNRGKIPCPFCQKTFAGLNYGPGRAKKPLQAKCCGAEVFLNEADMPADYPAKPNLDVKTLLPDGRELVYHYYAPEGAEDASEWFHPGQEMAAAQAEFLQKNLGFLIYTAVGKQDPKARAMLVELVKALPARLANQPWCVNFRHYQPAESSDFPTSLVPPRGTRWKPESGPLSKQESAALLKHFKDGELLSLEESSLSIWRMFPNERGLMALLAEAYGAVAADLDEASRKQVESALRDLFCFVRHAAQRRGNFLGYTLPDSLSIAIASQDQVLFENLQHVYFDYLTNHYYDDGASVEGSSHYAGMLDWMLLDGMKERFGDKVVAEFAAQRPLLHEIIRQGSYPIRTLWGIENQSGDAHLGFFRSTVFKPYEQPAYGKLPVSQLQPSRGVACLRSGKPGDRMESIMDFRSSTLHTQGSRLNLQLFYEGVSLLPELGYAARGMTADYSQPGFPETPFKLKPQRPWFQASLEAHNTATINGNQGDDPNTRMHAYYASAEDPSLRLVQVELPKENFEKFDGQISCHDRQLVSVGMPGGRSVLMSVYRLVGGDRHDVYWHVAGEPGTSSLGKAKPEPEPNLLEYFNAHAQPKPGAESGKIARRNTFKLIAEMKNEVDPNVYGHDSEQVTQIRSWQPKPQQAWSMQWTVDPKRYIYDREPEPFLREPIELRMWAKTNGSPANEKNLGARIPWPGVVVGPGPYTNKLVCYQEALDHLTQHRQKQGDGTLSSTFINILEPFKKAQGAVLSSVDYVADDNPALTDRSAVILKDAAKNPVYLITNPGEDRFENNKAALHMQGRLGKLSPAEMELTLYQGTSFSAAGWSLEMAPEPELTLVGVQGDITGTPGQSALIVKSSALLAAPRTYAGGIVFVGHQQNPTHQSNYQIEKVTALGDHHYRIDLQGNPPFILAALRVNRLENHRKFVHFDSCERFKPTGQDGLGRLVYFPRQDFRTVQTGAKSGGSAEWVTHGIYLKDKLPETVQPGDPLMLYSIQKNDAVRMPGHFSCRRDNNHLIIHTTAQAVLTIPAQLNIRAVGGIEVTDGGDHTVLSIPAGRHQLEITPATEPQPK